MLTIFGSGPKQGSSYCDRIDRRAFLRVGALGLGGLTLADLLRASESTGTRRTKSVIMIYLSGGPPHQDTYDMKPNGPPEVRGEFLPTDTNVPGVQICDLMPRQAQIADKLAIVRGIKTVGYHTAYEFYSGFAYEPGKNVKMRPPVGSVVSYFRGMQHGMPPYVGVGLVTRDENPAYLGPAHAPYVVSRESREGTKNLEMPKELTLERLDDRTKLLAAFDRLNRSSDTSGKMDAMDAFTVRAVEMTASGGIREALDISREPAEVQQRYGDGRPRTGQQLGPLFLRARRLVEAGAQVMTIGIPGWDTHVDNYPQMRRMLPVLDQALAALIEDLHERGLADDTLVVMGGEMGRTAKINDRGGRDHWPQAGFTLFAGGGLRTGQTVGETDRRAEYNIAAPYGPQNLVATIYHHLGIDPKQTIADFLGRPQYVLDNPEPIRELV